MRFWIGGPRLFGLRTGANFGPEDFARTRKALGGAPVDLGGFVYVIKGDHGLIKVGSSTNPNARLANLRTASPFPLTIVYCAAPKENYEQVEKVADAILDRYRTSGGWFDCPLDAAVVAISVAAQRLGVPMVQIDVSRIDEVLRLAAQSTGATETALPPGRMPGWIRALFFIFPVLAFALLYWAGLQRETLPGVTIGLLLGAAIPYALFSWIWAKVN